MSNKLKNNIVPYLKQLQMKFEAREKGNNLEIIKVCLLKINL